MNSQVEQLASVIADTIGIEGIRFDADNSISLEFDNTLINLVVIEQQLVLHADLAHLSGFSEDAAFFRFLLAEDEASEFAGGNCYLTVDRMANSIELNCALAPLEALNKEVLAGAFARFYELIRYWSLKLNRFSLPQQDAEMTAQTLGNLV